MNTTIFFSPEDEIDVELKTKITEICTPGVNKTVIKADLEDNQKRWLLVGICLQSIVSTTLRNYTEQVVLSLYNALKRSHKIHTQTYPNQQKMYPKSTRQLNYEAINKNHSIARIGRKPDIANYDYKVGNHVEFSKLFMQTYMAHYTAFDETCDLSALLSLIVSIDTFPQPVKNVAMKLRSDVRNPWAHCNFDEWDTIRYQTSFQLMHQLIKCLNLNKTDETNVLSELTKWETNGFLFLQGYSVDQSVVTELRQQTQILAEYALKMKAGHDSTFKKVHEAMSLINGGIASVCKRIENIDINLNEQQRVMEEINKDVTILYDRTSTIENVNTEQGVCIEGVITNIQELNQDVGNFKSESLSTIIKVEKLADEVKATSEDVSYIKSDISEIKENVGNFKNYMSQSKPTGTIFFYPPNRSEYFVSREKEMNQIQSEFVNKDNENHTLVLCGLGGCGKTTLAIEFAWRSQEFYLGGIFWMSAESENALEDSIATLAIDVNTTGTTFKETFRKTLKWFSNMNERWLLVVDNADEEYLSDYIKELLVGSWKRNTRGHILITTRRESNEIEESMLVKPENCICICIFGPTEAIEFVKRRTGRNDTDEENVVLSLVEELGGLPLALEQAAAHIKSIKCSFADYVKRFEKKRIKLLKAAPSSRKITKDRLAVATTWQLNIEYISRESENEGLGTAAITIMEIASFLFADDIPKALINIGNPVVEDSALIETLDDDVGCKQIIEILTRFSLFQFMKDMSLSVHRLVQEVIRDNMNNDRRYCILQHASRMVKKALDSCVTPNHVLRVENNDTKRGSLFKWSKLAANANTLKGHLFLFVKNDESRQDIFFNDQMLKILQTTALYHSIYQRQALALADQEQMVQIITTLSVDFVYYYELTSLKIPLLQKDREVILECLASVIHDDNKEIEKVTSVIVPYKSETLREMGNKAFNEHRYYDAIQCYTEGIRSCSTGNIDSRFYANRSLAYIRINDYEHALNDASTCIDIAPGNWKGYCWKAYSVSFLIKTNSLSSNMKAVGIASACIASYKNNVCRSEYKMKICYPVLNYKIVDNPESLRQEIMALEDSPFTTLMLRQGRYTIRQPVFTTKSIQVIGAEEGVEIDTGNVFCICRIPSNGLPGHIEPEDTIYAHFENITFLKGGSQIVVKFNSVATFYRCKFSNGGIGCEYFPQCKGEAGCINPYKCKTNHQSSLLGKFANTNVGEVGSAGICASDGGTIYIDSCVLDRCGGGGVLSTGDGSFIEIKNSTVCNMRQMGIEARQEGVITATNNIIAGNQTHGVAIGPNGCGYISGNIIQGNGSEGVWSGGNIKKDELMETIVRMDEKGASRAVLCDNIIRQNGLSGISLDGGYYEVKGNRIFCNWLWGIMVKSRSYSYILNNDICENKCGGIRIGHNYTATVFIDGNTIKEHIGPGIYMMNSTANLLNKLKSGERKKALADQIRMTPVADGELSGDTREPFISSTNVLNDNERGIQHPQNVFSLIVACCFCRKTSQQLKSCSRCKKAKYCKKDCQTKHWKTHKHMCKLLNETYSIEVQMCNTQPNTLGVPAASREEFTINLRTFSPKLVGIGEGNPPDRRSSEQFIVKIQSGKEYGYYDPFKWLIVYDQTVTLDIQLSNPELYHLCNECGVLTGQKLSAKKIFCWASFKDNGNTICFHTYNLPPMQTW